jgi:V/A-type H+-transporting ATPase subunit A
MRGSFARRNLPFGQTGYNPPERNGQMMKNDVIYSVNGPVITVRNTDSFSMMEMVQVGEAKLIGEVIAVNEKYTTIQVYENTTGLTVGEPVFPTGAPLSATLGPGIMQNIFDGIERPLPGIAETCGAFIANGMEISALNEEKLWDVTMQVRVGDVLTGGAVIASCPETSAILHKSMVPPHLSGTVVFAAENGQYTIRETLCILKDANGAEHKLALAQKWPIRTARPVTARESISRPLITGQRVIDSLFPIAKGGTAAIPGGFGTGKTMTQHQLAKWCDADIIVYVGCGERGNEMTQVLEEFGELIDPKSGRPMTDRTVLIANTSNMPVAAREASIYTGITLAEYYRDMGYDVAIMADSTSRWAEALREISGRLEEMPAEEGFPAYLPSRLAEFYERAGCTQNLNGSAGSVTIIGAVSPQGSDFSEPVTQNTKRFVRCFLALDKSLAYARHYPAINWNISYSEYYDDLDPYFAQHAGAEFPTLRARLLSLLNEETKLMEIVKLIGSDVLPDNQKVVIEIARVIRTGFLQQNAYHADDTYVPLEKQLLMMKIITYLYDKAQELVSNEIPVRKLTEAGMFDKLVKMKYEIPNDKPELFDSYYKEIGDLAANLLAQKAGA